MSNNPPASRAAAAVAPPPREKPERKYRRPVAWLLGRQLIASLKGTLLYTAFGSKLDPRGWMQAKVFRFDIAERFNADAPGDEFWFDYLSDSGDGMRATYSLAFLSLSKLWARDPRDTKPAAGADSALKPAAAAGYEFELPRGEFLFVGGDTAYHMSDYATLGERFYKPFNWAFLDLRELGRISETEPRRPLFGIPGNHDYYDQLDGFRRQFRRPIRAEAEGVMPDETDTTKPQLMLAGLKRVQEASYVALRLPFGWWMWALDTEVGKVDERQRKFFVEDVREFYEGEAAASGGRTPDKLIVATCAPTTVHGKFADVKDEKSARAFLQLDLPRPFMREADLEPNETRLLPTQCRLDISGDVHHYARYWGPRADGAERTRAHSKPGTPLREAANYASVMSGLGGAFHHPSQTYVSELQEQALYPSESDSRGEVAKQIFKPWKLLNGGGVWLVGFILAFVIYFGVSVPQSSREAFNTFPVWDWFGVSERDDRAKSREDRINPTVPAADARQTATPFWLWRRLGIAPEQWSPPTPSPSPAAPSATPNKAFCAGAPAYFWGPCAVEKTPPDYKIGVALLFVSLALVVAGIVAHIKGWLFHDPDNPNVPPLRKDGMAAPKAQPEGSSAEEADKEPTPWYGEVPFRRVGVFVLLTIFCAALGVYTLKPYRANITPFGNSLLVLLGIVWSVTGTALNVRYSEWLFDKASVRNVGRMDWAMTWVLTVASVVSLGACLWFFGQNNLPAYLAADIILVTLPLAAFVLIVLLGVLKAGELKKSWRKLPYGLLGLFHALLQIAIPFLLVRKGSRLTFVVAAVLVLVFGLLGWQLMKRDLRLPLLIAWLVYGGLMLSLPYLTYSGPEPYAAYRGLWPTAGWEATWPSLIAGVIGLWMVCVWLGWYLAVSLCFHGHNNEAGGAARIERFKQFVRFRLTADGLTGYVIAVDDPKEHGADLEPRLVDVFHLKAERGS